MKKEPPHQKKQETLLQIIRIYSKDIGMEIDIEKYSMPTMKTGKDKQRK